MEPAEADGGDEEPVAVFVEDAVGGVGGEGEAGEPEEPEAVGLPEDEVDGADGGGPDDEGGADE